jgi:hypothetical protein
MRISPIVSAPSSILTLRALCSDGAEIHAIRISCPLGPVRVLRRLSADLARLSLAKSHLPGTGVVFLRTTAEKELRYFAGARCLTSSNQFSTT